MSVSCNSERSVDVSGRVEQCYTKMMFQEISRYFRFKQVATYGAEK